tara:strand:+ start:1900 stop:2034 length:135 start_codon:yes stop_codon:yes gene_type:complete
MIEGKKNKGMLMSAFMVALAVAGGILLADVAKKNLMGGSKEQDI